MRSQARWGTEGRSLLGMCRHGDQCESVGSLVRNIFDAMEGDVFEGQRSGNSLGSLPPEVGEVLVVHLDLIEVTRQGALKRPGGELLDVGRVHMAPVLIAVVGH